MPPRAQQLLEAGRFEEALISFDSGNDLGCVFGRGVALQMLGRLDEAEAAYDRVLAADPKHTETLANLVALSVEKFDLERVEEYARRLLDLDCDSVIALRGLTVVAVERRDYESAANWFARLAAGDDHCRDAVEYRLSRQVVDRLREHHGSVTRPY